MSEITFTYSGDPAASDLDGVRFRLQDTDPTDPLMSDEEIQYEIDSWLPRKGTLAWVASVCAERLAARFAREVMVAVDGVSAGVEALQAKYQALAEQLRDEHKEEAGSGVPDAGGTLFGEEFDSTIKPLSFGKGMHDNLRGGVQDRAGVGQLEFFTLPEDAL